MRSWEQCREESLVSASTRRVSLRCPSTRRTSRSRRNPRRSGLFHAVLHRIAQEEEADSTSGRKHPALLGAVPGGVARVCIHASSEPEVPFNETNEPEPTQPEEVEVLPCGAAQDCSGGKGCFDLPDLLARSILRSWEQCREGSLCVC